MENIKLRVKLKLGKQETTFWPYQSGRTTEWGMSLAEAMLKAEALGLKGSDVKMEHGGSYNGCDMQSYPDGGGTYSVSITSFYVERLF